MTASEKKYARIALETLSQRNGRDALVDPLENIGTACYDDEPEEDLIESIIDSMEVGDIDRNTIGWDLRSAQGYGNEAYHAWLDI